MTTAIPRPVAAKGPSMPEFIALIALITSLVALSIDAMLPALPRIAEDLQVIDYRQTQWVITSLILGMSFGQLLFGPFSDSFGRKPTIILGVALFCVGSLISMTADSLAWLLAGRILQGFAASGPRIASTALVRDKYVGDQMARVMSFIMMVFIIVPMLAPIIGQWILDFSGWRAIFALFIALSSSAALWLALRQPETLMLEARRPFHTGKILTSALRVVRHPKVMGFSVTSGFVFGGLLSYVASSQAIFQGIYQLGENFPYYFAFLAFGIGFASLVNGTLVVRLGSLRLTLVALYALISLSALLLVVSIAFAGVPPLLVFMALAFVMFFSLGLLFGNLNSLAMIPVGRMAGMGAAVIGSVSNIVAVVFSGAVGWFFHDSLVPIAAGIFIAAVISLLIINSIDKLDDSPL